MWCWAWPGAAGDDDPSSTCLTLDSGVEVRGRKNYRKGGNGVDVLMDVIKTCVAAGEEGGGGGRYDNGGRSEIYSERGRGDCCRGREEEASGGDHCW